MFHQILKQEVDGVTLFPENAWLSGYPPRIFLQILPEEPATSQAVVNLEVSGVVEHVVFFVIPSTTILPGTLL